MRKPELRKRTVERAISPQLPNKATKPFTTYRKLVNAKIADFQEPLFTMPKTYIIPVKSVAQLHSVGNHKFFVGTAIVSSFPTDLPLTPNIREPNKKASVFKEILETLNSAPSKFFDRNNGIKISAYKVKIQKTSSGEELHVEFLEDSEGYTQYGVYDGGHTIATFSTAIMQKIDLKKALVKVEITCGLPEEEVSVNALTANTTSPIDTRSRVNARGGYDFIKRFIEQLELDTPHA